MLNFCDFIQDYVFGTNHHLKGTFFQRFVIQNTQTQYKDTAFSNYVKLACILCINR